MRRFAIIAALTSLALACGLNEARAQTATGVGVGTSSSSSSSGASSSITFNQPGTVNSNVRYKQSGSVRTTPNAIAPGLGSAAIETCYGPGVSAGLAVTGFGASFGAGQYDSACNRRLNARTIYAFGFKRQALSIMLNEPEVAAAFGAGQEQVSYGVPARAARGSGACQKWRDNVVGLQCLY